MGSTDISATIDDGTATLLCGSAMGGATTEACTEMLRADPDRYVLWVTFAEPPDACVERLPEREAARMGVVRVGGGSTRSTATDTGGRGIGATAIADPSDLTGLSIAVDRYLSRHDRVALCFDSVTALLQYVGRDRAYQFLNDLTERLWRAGATAHFHVDPDAHDPATVELVTSLVDARVDVDE